MLAYIKIYLILIFFTFITRILNQNEMLNTYMHIAQWTKLQTFVKFASLDSSIVPATELTLFVF